MPVAIEIPQEAVALPHKLWTRNECAVLERSGLVDLERYELIDGELIQKMGKNHPHTRALRLLMSWLEDRFGRDYCLQESAIDLRSEDHPTSEPEPDAVVLNGPFLALSAQPRPAELRLVVEVSSSTLYHDLVTKRNLYARSGIVDYWVLDLEGRRLIVHPDPSEGVFLSIQAFQEHEFVSALAVPDHEIRVGELLR